MNDKVFEWVAAEWPDPMQDLRDKAAAGDEIAALVCERVDMAVEAVLADVKLKWEAMWMEGGELMADGK